MSDKPRRQTRQRRVILEDLAKVKNHPTAAELYDTVRRRLPHISLATVYRNLELLTESGRIQKLQTAGEQARFDADTSPHDHVRCLRCGRVADVEGEPLVAFPPGRDDIGGFQIIGHRLEYLGICPECRAGRPEERPDQR